MSGSYSFEVNKTDLTSGRLIDQPDIKSVELAPHQALIAVEKFATTSNTITYGRAGDRLGYWDFFPASQTGWGRLPAWGIGRVLRSNSDHLLVGDRYYGYFPMSDYLVVTVGQKKAFGFIEASPHRTHLAAFYNEYRLMTEENGFPKTQDDYQIIYKPLFTTSFTIDIFLANESFFGADTVLLTSASSKTAIGLAYNLHKNRNIKILGLTSKGNAEFVRGLGLYSDVLTYDETDKITSPAVTVVDMAGNMTVVKSLRRSLGNRLVYFCGVGASHWNSPREEGLSKLGGAPRVGFFAPDVIKEIEAEWSPETFQAELTNSWNGFVTKISGLVKFSYKSGDDIGAVYSELVKGVNPTEALILENAL